MSLINSRSPEEFLSAQATEQLEASWHRRWHCLPLRLSGRSLNKKCLRLLIGKKLIKACVFIFLRSKSTPTELQASQTYLYIPTYF